MKAHIQNPKNFLTKSLLVLALGSFAFVSCNDAPEDPKKVAEEHNEAKFDNTKENDADFLVRAAEINMEEIELGKLAQTKGSMADVKELGKMMETEHSKALADLQSLAAKKTITLPAALSTDAQDVVKKLSEKSGKDFDKEYCDKMVNGHKDAIEKFTKASNDASDPEIKDWATVMLPTLRMHLDHSMSCQEKCEKAN